MEIAGLDDGADRPLVHVVDVAMADLRHRGGVAAAHAGRSDHPHAVAEGIGQCLQQRPGAGQLARKAVADPHRDCRRRRLVLGEHVEVRVERRGLVDLGHRQAHLVGQRGEVRRADAVPAVLDQVQVLDEEVAVARTVAEQGADLVERGRVDLPSLRSGPRRTPPGARMAAALGWFDVGRHSGSGGDCRVRRISGASRLQPIPFVQGDSASDDSFDFPNHHAKLWNRVFIVRWQGQPMALAKHELMP